MWSFLIVFPVAWLISEICRAPRGTRMTSGLLALIAVAWMTYTSMANHQEMTERIVLRTERRAFGSLYRVLREGDTNGALTALAAYDAMVRTGVTFRATSQLAEHLQKESR